MATIQTPLDPHSSLLAAILLMNGDGGSAPFSPFGGELAPVESLHAAKTPLDDDEEDEDEEEDDDLDEDDDLEDDDLDDEEDDDEDLEDDDLDDDEDEDLEDDDDPKPLKVKQRG